MKNVRFLALILILVGLAIGYYSYKDTNRPYKLGLDLNGGTHLVYQADVSRFAFEVLCDLNKVLHMRPTTLGDIPQICRM